MRKVLAMLMAVVMTLSLIASSAWAEPAGTSDITIYYTNDVHTYINNYDEKIGSLNTYAKLATLKKTTENVLLVDAGDHIQGTAFGGMDNGATIVKLMNETGYDLATLGNHEFDYDMPRTMEVINQANFPYISCNFYHESNKVPGDLVLDAYKTFEVAGKKIAFVGITTPESITKSTPVYFQDGNGNYIYGIGGGDDGKALYEYVQKGIDAAKAAGADYIIALGHLGVDPSSKPWTSEEVIANTTGLDAFIDGHSHTTLANKLVKDKAGNDVTLSQTGSYFNKVGKMVISDTGFTTELIDINTVAEDATVKATQDAWIASVKTQLGAKIADTTINFTDSYPDTGKRAVRSSETNMGDLNADAYYWNALNAGLEPDMAIMNGGGIRAGIPAGDWTYESCKTVNTFGNMLCVVEITGQQIKDALEYSARFTTGNSDNTIENGGFLHVAGCTYKVDANIENTVQMDGKLWGGGPTGEYRVSDIRIFNRTTGQYDALDLNKTYRVCGTNYTLYNCGDGFNMFQGGKHVLDGIAEDYLAMAAYLKAFKDTDNDGYAEITSANSPLAALNGYQINYESATGAGRIDITELVTPPWDGKITIGGTELNLWFTKYGNVYCDCTVAHFTGTEDNGLGFQVGDIVTLEFLGNKIQLPVVNNYTDVDSGKAAVKLGSNQYVELFVNMGSFAQTYGLASITKDAAGNYIVTPAEGVTFPVELKFEMYEKGGYWDEYVMHQLKRTDKREDYPKLSDAEFANFRNVATTGMGKDKLYRGSSPINPELARNAYADAALKAAGVTVIMNLADSEAAAKAYAGFDQTYYSGQKVIYLNLGVDFTAPDFQKGLAEGLRFFAANKGTYYVHCTEGKDRAGFVSALLECLMGATYDEVVADYMTTYYNYYGVDKDKETEKYNTIANSNIIATLQRAFGVKDLSKADLQAGAKGYMKNIGLSDAEISALMVNLGYVAPPATGDAGVMVYMGMAIMALTGGVFVARKKELF